MLNSVITKGNLAITYSQNNVSHYGNGSGAPVHIRIHDSQWEKQIALNSALKLGEAYMEDGFDFAEGAILALLHIVFAGNNGNAEKTFWLLALQDLRRLSKRLTLMNSLQRSSGYIPALSEVLPSIENKRPYYYGY